MTNRRSPDTTRKASATVQRSRLTLLSGLTMLLAGPSWPRAWTRPAHADALPTATVYKSPT